MKKVSSEGAFYFSYDIDLTKNMQKTFEDIETATLQNDRMKGSMKSGYAVMREAYPNSADYLPHYAFNH